MNEAIHYTFDDDGSIYYQESRSVVVSIGQMSSKKRASEIVAMLHRDQLFEELVGACGFLASAVRGFLAADRQEHLRTRFSDDENDKFDRIIEALGPANIILAKVEALKSS
jgi:hypothetical protein